MRNQQLLAVENFAYLKNASMFAECCAWAEDKLCDLWYSAAFKFCAFLMKKWIAYEGKHIAFEEHCSRKGLLWYFQIYKCFWIGCEKIVWIALVGGSGVVASTRGLVHQLVKSYQHLKSYHHLIHQNVVCCNWILHFIIQKTIWKISCNYVWAKSFVTATSAKNFSKVVSTQCEEMLHHSN
jgi:hypothetical protein